MTTGLPPLIAARNVRYGSTVTRSRIEQALKAAMRDSRNWSVLDPCMKSSLEMIVVKISRILNGDPRHTDSWLDIAGYAQLVADEVGRERCPSEDDRD